jgi:CheY-like chemotaxis protein
MMSGERILIVEDDEYLRKASEIALRRAGFTVTAAATGREGLSLARADRPDLIILDLLMPQPTGLEILRTLRGEAATKTTPVMVISNSSMQRVVDEVTGLGADYIVKADLSLKDLAGRVEKKLATALPAAPAPAAPAVGPSVRPAPPVVRPAAPAPASPAAPAPPASAAATPSSDPAPDDPAPAPAKEREPRILPEPRPVLDSETVECAGCGSIIGINVRFCPKCGRQLTGPTGGRSWRPLSR